MFYNFGMDGFGEISTLLAYIMVIEKGHTYFYVCVLVHDYQCYSFVCSKDYAVVVLLQIVQGLPFILGNTGFWCFRLITVVSKYIFDFDVVLPAFCFSWKECAW